MKKLLIVEADWNDADYVYSFHYDVSKEVAVLARKIAKAIKDVHEMPKNKYNRQNWVGDYTHKEPNCPYNLYKDILTEEEIESFEEFVPCSYDGSIHSITNIQIIYYEEIERIY